MGRAVFAALGAELQEASDFFDRHRPVGIARPVCSGHPATSTEDRIIADYRFHGHAIVSADDRIADASGRTPPSLCIPADWERFQAQLDRAVVSVVGRLGHEANPNVKGRNRLVLSSSARGVERRAGAWWWNPRESPLAAALALAAPAGGIVAVPGGRRVFDLFLSVGYDAFHLARAHAITIPDGIPIFSQVSAGRSADAILAAQLVAGPREILDADADVSITVWRRRGREAG